LILLKSAARLLFLTGVSVALYVGVSHLFASSMDGEGMSLARSLLFETRRSEALRLRASEVAQSMETKRAITDDLIAARMTLREAEEKFRAASAMVEKTSGGFLPSYRSPESDRGVGQQVLAWVNSTLQDKYTPRQAKQVRRRLRREYKEQFAQPPILQ
jgi:hypothetical protein